MTTSGGLTRSLLRALAVVVVLLTTLHTPARADRVDDLTKTLASSSNEKTRLAAVTALSRLGDKRALKPLVTALSDPNSQIRGVAAAGLGKLGHKAALPQLRNVANDDLDGTVRALARDAAIAVAKTNKLPTPFAVEERASTPPAARLAGKSKKARAGFGNQPHAIDAETADTYVLINSSADDSPGRADKVTRQSNAQILKTFLMDQFRANPQVTTVAADAERLKLTSRCLDLSVVKLEVVTGGTHVEIEAQLRLAISDHKGKMLSFVSGGAKVQVSKKSFNLKYLASMRREVLEGAVRGLYDKLLAQLRDHSQS